MIPQLLQPPRDILVGLVLADIVDKQSSNSTPVVRGCDGSISLLPCCIPDLCFDRLCVYLNGPGCELYTDCGLGVEVELIRVNLLNRLDFPTPESPIRTTRRCQFRWRRGD